MRVPNTLLLATVTFITVSGTSVAMMRESNHPLTLEAWTVSGYRGLLTPGMRVDAVFWAARGPDDGVEVTRRMLLVLQNVKVLASVGSGAEMGRHPQITTLLLTDDQVNAVKGLQPSVLELIVKIGTHGKTLIDRRSSQQPPLHSQAINKGREPNDSYAGTSDGEKSEDRVWSIVRSPRQDMLGDLGQHMALPILILIIIACMAEELHIMKRRRTRTRISDRSDI
jgi:hypothetical protein